MQTHTTPVRTEIFEQGIEGNGTGARGVVDAAQRKTGRTLRRARLNNAQIEDIEAIFRAEMRIGGC